MKRNGPLKRTPLKRRGEKSLAWEKFRNEKAERDRDEEGLLYCQDWKIDLPRCGYGLPSLDLHHVEGRDGKLMFDETKMVWLTRGCHDAAHNKH